MAAMFELITSADGEFRFNLKSANGEIILTSELYNMKTSAVAGIASVKINAPVETRFERKLSSAKQPYFVLKAANGQLIGTSQMYSSAAAMEGGIAAVQATAPKASTKEM